MVKELYEIEEEIALLRSIGDELSEEEEELRKIKKEFAEINEKLGKHLEELRMENPPSINFRLGLESWAIIEEANNLRHKVDRWTKREIKDYDRLVTLLDEQLRRRGIGEPSSNP